MKKYRKWTKDRDTERRFKSEITSSSDSFYQLDLGYLLDQYIHVLGALRANFDTLGAPRLPLDNAKASPPLLEFAKATNAGTDVDFDLALSLTPLGTSGTKATYWVHPDHVVETTVLLLQHMSLFPGLNETAANNLPQRNIQRSTSFSNTESRHDDKNAAGLVVLDHPEWFAIKQNASTVGSIEETAGTIQVKAAGNVRWAASGNAAVVVNLDLRATKEPMIARLKRKQLAQFFDASSPLHRQQDLELQHQDQGKNSTEENGVNTTCEWLKEHDEVRPIAGICSKRTRFVGLHNNHYGGIWAILDEDIFMKSTIYKNLGDDDWAAAAREESIAFPHAVLEIRREGIRAANLIQTLDRSHLVCSDYSASISY